MALVKSVGRKKNKSSSNTAIKTGTGTSSAGSSKNTALKGSSSSSSNTAIKTGTGASSASSSKNTALKGNSGSSSTAASGSSANTALVESVGRNPATTTKETSHANDSPLHQAAYDAAKSGNWDLAAHYINQMAGVNEFGELVSGAEQDYFRALQDEFKYDANKYYGAKYDAVYGTGAWDGGTGTGKPVFNDYSQALVDAHKQNQIAEAIGNVASTPTVQQNNASSGTVSGTTSTPTVQQTTGNGNSVSPDSGLTLPQYGTTQQPSAPSVEGYESFEEFLAGMGYDSYEEETKKAIQAAVQNAVNGYNQQIQTTNNDTAELARQAYISKMLGEKNLDQQLAANGYAGGMADSQRIALQANYETDLNELEKQRVATVKELETAITNAQLTGDMQTAQELSGYLQQIQSQWVNYVQNQQALANQNYWNQQNLNNNNYWNQQNLDNQNYWKQQSLSADIQSTARNWALTLIQSGTMPDDETLTAAGLSRAQAQTLMGVTGSTTNSTSHLANYNNGSLSTNQVKQMQNYLGVTPDGLWGSESSGKANGMTADQAWAEYQKVMNGYDNVRADIQALRASGESAATINSVISAALRNGQITSTEAMQLRGSYVGSGR